MMVPEENLNNFWNILLPIDFLPHDPNANFCLSYKTSFYTTKTEP